MSKPDKPKRVYQVWKGSNRFFCGGRLIFGPDVSSLFFSTFLIAVPAIAFCMKTYCLIVDEHTKNPEIWYPVLIIGCILTVLDLVFLFLTSSRDPGIVSRNARPPEAEETCEANTPSMEWVNGRTPHLKLPRTKEVNVNGHSVKVKYCDTCFLYRPPRVSHCSICNNCVKRFDHHCPWVGQCIGERNYRFFFMFVSTATILCIYVFVFSWISITSEKGNLRKAMLHNIVSDILIVYCFIAVWFVGGLTVFHCYLICTNQTTYENFRYRYDKKENPYNRGMIKNISEVFFAKIPPSMNKFRAIVEEEEQMSVAQHIMAPNFGEDYASSKEKIDIEMGNMLAEDNHFPLPAILRNLDFDDESDDCPKVNEDEEGRPAIDQCPDDQVDGEPFQLSVVEDHMRECVQDLNVADDTRGLGESARRSSYEDGVRGLPNSFASKDAAEDSINSFEVEDVTNQEPGNEKRVS